MWVMSRAQLETNLRETDVLLDIVGPVMDFLEVMHAREDVDYYSDDSNEADRLQAHIEVLQASDNALMQHYTTVDRVLEAREEWIRGQEAQPYRDNMREPINNYKALHVLTCIQETWLVKFSGMVSAHDTWGRVFLGELRGFGDELQKLTGEVHSAFPPSVTTVWPVHLATQWRLTARKFYCVLLFLFDVGLTLEAGTNARTFRNFDVVEQSPAFSCRSDVRSRVLAHAAFITHLETCAWKVLAMHPSIRGTYRECRAADWQVSRRVYQWIREVRRDCNRSIERLHADGTGPRVSAAAEEALAWREQYRDGAGSFAERYEKVLAELQQDLAVRLALVATAPAAHGVPAAAHGRADGPNTAHAKLRQLALLR